MSNRTHQLSMNFKSYLLKEYYESGNSMYSIIKKHGVDDMTFLRWVKLFESKPLPLPKGLIYLSD